MRNPRARNVCARLKRGLLPVESGAFIAASPNSVFAMFSSIVFALLNKPAALVARPLVATVTSAVGTLVVLLALLIGGALYLQKKRSDKIEAAARALGFTFRRKATKEDKALIVGSHLAKAGYARSVHNVLQASGPAELTMFLFDYSYAIGHIKDHDRSIGQTIIRMHSPLLRLPPFSISPERTFSKIGKVFGYSNINFSEVPDFSRKYLLRGLDEAAVRQLFNSSIIQFFEQERDLTVEAAGDLMFLYRYNKIVKAEEMGTFVETGKRALALLLQAQPGIA
jgi:hypothetical protein